MEKRKFGRVRVFTAATLYNRHGDKFGCSIFDLSKGGVGLMSSHPDIDTSIVYEIRVEKMLKRSGMIKHDKPVEGVVKQERGHKKTQADKYGFKFTRPLTTEEFIDMMENFTVVPD